MSDTPETQKAVLDSDGQWSFVLKDCCERLERERDEAREELEEYRSIAENIGAVKAVTPETDDFELNLDDYNHPWKAIEFARKLERERDEARNELCDIRLNLGEDAEGYTLTHAVCVLQNERNEAMEDSLEQARLLGMGSEREAKLISERDEARTDLEFRRGLYKVQEQYLETARRERDEAREKYATEATEHMLAINKLFNERDEAREENAKLRDIAKRAINIPQIIELADGTKCVRLEDFLRERDEAQNEILGWKNKWECAVEMAARAGVERDEAMEALMKIEDLFIDGTDIYADRESMGLIARAALGETK